MSKSKHVQPTPRVWVGACTLCDGCILAAGHRGKHKVAEMEEEEYEVELILSERRGRAGGGPAPRAARRCETETAPLVRSAGSEYLVKWKGWPLDDATWEAAPALANCPKVLQAWRARSAEASRPASQQEAADANAPVEQPPGGRAAAAGRRARADEDAPSVPAKKVGPSPSPSPSPSP